MATSNKKRMEERDKAEKVKKKEKMRIDAKEAKTPQKKDTKIVICNYCKKQGHLLRSCRKRRRKIKEKRMQQEEKRESKFINLVEILKKEFQDLKCRVEECTREMSKMLTSQKESKENRLGNEEVNVLVQDQKRDQDAEKKNLKEKKERKKPKKKEEDLMDVSIYLSIYQNKKRSKKRVAVIREQAEKICFVKIEEEMLLPDPVQLRFLENTKFFDQYVQVAAAVEVKCKMKACTWCRLSKYLD